MDLQRFTEELPAVLDDHQCFPLTEDGVIPSFRAVYLPTFNNNVIVTLRCPSGQPATLTVTSTEAFEKPYIDHQRLRRRLALKNRSKKQRRRAQHQRTPEPEPPPPLTFPWPLAWWVLPSTRRMPALFQRIVPVPEDTLAQWRGSLTGLDLLMSDHEPALDGRDGMVTIGEVLLPHGTAAFSAWHPEADSPWDRFFTAMLDLCEVGCDDPLIAERLAELRRYR
ncbi:MAG: hypothetical protein ACI8RZ_002816 [Myxococcota bacterium]|jgi:hypothetical protein